MGENNGDHKLDKYVRCISCKGKVMNVNELLGRILGLSVERI